MYVSEIEKVKRLYYDKYNFLKYGVEFVKSFSLKMRIKTELGFTFDVKLQNYDFRFKIDINLNVSLSYVFDQIFKVKRESSIVIFDRMDIYKIKVKFELFSDDELK